jgi:drug/metabolite transporter (DMT)-like permease
VQLAQKPEPAEVEHREETLPIQRQKSESILHNRIDRIPPMDSRGSLLCLSSAAAFGAMAIFGKLAFDEGATAGTLLAVRFLLAASVLWAILVARGGWARLRATPARDVRIALGLGACGYALQAGCYFLALQRIEASLLSLLLYTFPAIVTIAAVLLGRERLDGRRVAALLLVSAGLTLVLAGAGTGALAPLGVVLALGAAFVYSAYILVSDGIARRLDPMTLSTLVCTGAAVSLTIGSAAIGAVHPGDLSAAGWGWLACLSLVSTVGAIAMFFAGLGRVGPSAASILSTVEPLVTVGLAAVVFGERLSGAQLVGGALVLGAVLVLRLGRAATPRTATAASPAARPARARGLRRASPAAAARRT